MPESINNFKLRAALLERGFEDITSQNRSTKSWKLRHPQMGNWVSIKLAQNTGQAMAKAPLVIHPDDARRVQFSLGSKSGVVFEAEPYKGNSTRYHGGVLGRALSLADLAAVEAFIAAAAGVAATPSPVRVWAPEPGPSSGRADDAASDDIDPFLLSAAAAEVDADLAGQNVAATTRRRLVHARLGQGQYRRDMVRIWGGRCAVTGCSVIRALVASHAIAWRDNKDSAVRLDPYNGLLLTASIDRLFDQGLIGFSDDGRLLRKVELSSDDIALLGMQADARLRRVDLRHQPYLAAHRARHDY